ncbi:hypothetical protein N7470_008100 [Penicillium chermesinum]|nr:hypothetical protein N7470_008100 [Penicillium chermesinum]
MGPEQTRNGGVGFPAQETNEDGGRAGEVDEIILGEKRDRVFQSGGSAPNGIWILSTQCPTESPGKAGAPTSTGSCRALKPIDCLRSD